MADLVQQVLVGLKTQDPTMMAVVGGGTILALLVGASMASSCSSTRATTKSGKKKKKKKSKKAKEPEGNKKSQPKSKPKPQAKKQQPKKADTSKGKKGKKGKKGANAEKKPVEPEYSDDDDDPDAILFAKTELPVSASELRRRKMDTPAQSSKNKKKKGKEKKQLEVGATDRDGFTVAGAPKKKNRRGRGGGGGGSQQQQQQGQDLGAGEARELLDIEPRHYGLLIGPGGSTLKMMQEGSNTRIDIPKRESGLTQVVVTGKAADVKKARTAINMLITKGFSTLTHPGVVVSEVGCEARLIGAVVGPGGRFIKAIMEKTDTKVHMPDRSSTSSRITISGAKDGVKKAKAAVKSLIQNGFCQYTHPGFTKIDVEFPRAYFRLLIGPAGQTIKSIQGDTGCKVNIPDISNPNQSVVVVGQAADCARAKKQILRLIEREAEANNAPQQYDEEPEDEHFSGDDEYRPPERSADNGFVWAE